MKFEEIFVDLHQQINDEIWKPGERLPTERELAEKHKVSRPTIRRVLDRLSDMGLITRIVGAGTFVSSGPGPGLKAVKAIGLLIPGLGRGEIFEPICARIAELSQAFNFDLTWGSVPTSQSDQREAGLRQTVRRFIENGVDGVFFQPVERTQSLASENRLIVSMLESARMPFVLLDSDFVPYPQRSGHDLVGIDNIGAAWTLCEHFLSRGLTRVDFLWPPNTAQTYALRLVGYRQALLRGGVDPGPQFEHEGDPQDVDFVRRMIDEGARDIICVNDETAALLMGSVERLSLKVPGDIRVAGFDDVKYASLVRVPLTTMRQPCGELGEVALRTMFERIACPWLPPRTVSVSATLCVRASSGG